MGKKSNDYYSINGLYYDRVLATRVGDLIVVWSWAESVLVDIMTYFLSPLNPRIGYNTYLSYPNFRSRIFAIKIFINKSAWPAPTKKDLIVLIEELYDLWGTRNNWVHGRWATNKEKTRTYIIDIGQSPDSQEYRSNVTADQIEKHIENVCALKEELEKKLKSLFLVEALLHDTAGALPDKPKKPSPAQKNQKGNLPPSGEKP